LPVSTVISVRRATPSTRIVRLRLDTGAFTYRPGQAAQIGPLSSAVLAPYSIASAPEDTARDGCLEFLIRIDGGSGRWGEHFEGLRRGQRLRVKGPVGGFAFPDRPAEHRFFFIAGGTGVSPIRSMIRHVRASVPGRIRLLYSARTPLDFAYRQELCGMGRRGEIDVLLTATRDVPATWRGGRGRIARTQLAALIDDPATLCFVCGPASMVDEVPRMLRELGIERSRIRIEEW
jgi:ferredoxin-NADP reductase